MEALEGAAKQGARAVAVAVALACCALAVAPALASAATLQITTGPDPVESIATQIGASGSLETTNQELRVKVKPAGGPACGANPDADAGDGVIDRFPGIGPFAETANWTFDAAGSYLVCAWITDGARTGEPVLVAASQTLAVRIPHLSLTLAAPATVLRGRTFQIAATAQTEAQREVVVRLLEDTGRGCPANEGAAASAAGGLQLVDTFVLGGPTTETRNVQLPATGRYLVCGYVDYNEQVTPEAIAAATVNVVPPCIVPHLRPGTSLASAKARIVAAHCSVGKVVRARSRTRARGTVIALSPRPGSGHATHAPVQITVSSGPPPRRHRRHRG